MLAEQQLRPLPVLLHDFGDIRAAMRDLSQARHVGKVVVCLPAAVGESSTGLPGHKAWLVPGGLGALGSLAGAWLARQSVQHVILLGRVGGCGNACFACMPLPESAG